jgi:hypothetical protein
MRLILIVVAAACGGRATPDPIVKTAVPPPSADAAPPGPGCAASFDLALSGQPCQPDGARCQWALGTCTCLQAHPCSGAVRDPAEVALDPWQWSCVATDPSVLRADGCPAMGAPQGACADEGKVCDYSPFCGGIWTVATCRGGAWSHQSGETPPPP